MKYDDGYSDAKSAEAANLRGGDVGDRWALDVAGPLPATDGGKKYVVVAVEYVTRYAVTIAVKDHAAKSIAEFLMKQVVLRFGPFREILTDGASELVGKVIEELVVLLQAQQINPVTPIDRPGRKISQDLERLCGDVHER
ncbi:Pol Polyprotein [Phytophthora megakarya]|uniref:Pol Polyprotein n=1 Tax=Phytophthora megakarya TaxID=4795 RepID=A0A225UG44_9STRA|nr:Pol Polyprotein [Phytophthora megakarya]